jgi:imidazolonepropionase-like amidohydrolase
MRVQLGFRADLDVPADRERIKSSDFGLIPDGNRTLLDDPRLSPSLTEALKEQLRTPVPPNARAILERLIASVRRVHEAGVTLVVGTDAARGTNRSIGISLHRELELLHEAGLSPIEVLAAGTANVADGFRLTDRGRIALGRRADMLLVRGDPTSDILATRAIIRVWKSGIEVDSGLTGR